jgi:hypothetical protein
MTRRKFKRTIISGTLMNKSYRTRINQYASSLSGGHAAISSSFMKYMMPQFIYIKRNGAEQLVDRRCTKLCS